MLFVNRPSLFEAPYQRYLLNVFREQLPFPDIPIKLYLRARTQTDPSRPRHQEDEVPDITERPPGGNFNVDELDEEINDLLGDLDEG